MINSSPFRLPGEVEASSPHHIAFHTVLIVEILQDLEVSLRNLIRIYPHFGPIENTILILVCVKNSLP
jgi:hypothetical protein